MGGEYRLPVELRPRLSRPLGRLYGPVEIRSGELLTAVPGETILITVGDRVTETMGALGRVPDVQVVDARENRKSRQLPDVPYSRLVKVRNPAGMITEEAMAGIRDALSGDMPVRVMVEGEEDLLAIPAIAFAPTGSAVLYGQPGEGIVLSLVDGPSKERSRALLTQMGVPDAA